MNQDCPMTIINFLDTIIKDAMLSGDKTMLSIYRLAKAEMLKKQKEEGVEESAIDSEAVFKSMRKKLLEEIDMLEKAGRDTSTQQIHLNWIKSMLPQPVSEEDIRLDLQSWLPEQSESNKNIGFIMQHLKLVFHGRDLDGKLASSIVKELLQK